MKIICLARNLGMGGMERQISGLAVLLREQGYELTVLTYRREEDFFGLDLTVQGVKRLRLLRGRMESTALYILRLARLFRKERPDVVIAYGQGASRKAAVAHLVFRDFRLIVSERTANPRLNPFDLYKMLLYKLSSDVILTNSYALENLLSNAFPWLGSKLTCVPNFVQDSLFKPVRSGTDRGQFTIVTTSRVSTRKNIFRYIRAVRLALDKGADVRVLWYGRRVDSRRLCLKCDALIARLGLQDHFRLLDAVSNPETVYGSGSVFCLPSHYEGTSNALCEALACGLPVICADAGDNLRYVRDGVNGFVFDSYDIESMADAIVKISNTPKDVLEQMGRESRRVITSELSVDVFKERMNKLIKKITLNEET